MVLDMRADDTWELMTHSPRTRKATEEGTTQRKERDRGRRNELLAPNFHPPTVSKSEISEEWKSEISVSMPMHAWTFVRTLYGQLSGCLSVIIRMTQVLVLCCTCMLLFTCMLLYVAVRVCLMFISYSVVYLFYMTSAVSITP